MPPLWQDLRHAVRGLRARPGFSAAVILTLALGLGANAAIFSIVDRLLFRPPALMTHPDRVHRVAFAQSYRGKEYTNNSVPYARYEDLARWTTSFAHVALIAQRKVAVGVGPDAREMSVAAVSASFFQFFTAPPVIGRYFTTAEDAPPDGRPVAVVSYGWWQSRFGGRRDVLGSTVQVGPTVYTVIGVAPRGFTGIWSTQPPVAYVPISSFAAGMATGFSLGGEAWYRTYHWTWADMIAERQPGVSREAATADLTNAFIRSRDVQATVDKDLTPTEMAKPHVMLGSIAGQHGPDVSRVSTVSRWVGGVSLIVLLIACANVANLLLARALGRRREIAVRLALGVSRVRLASQLLAESLVLGVLGGGVGLAVAQFAGRVFRSVFLPPDATASVLGDRRTMVFAAAAAVAAGLATGLAPLVQSRHVDLNAALKSGAREGTRQRSVLRATLLVFQAALSVVLLVGAGVFVRSLQHARQVRLGFDAGAVAMVDLNMRGVPMDSARAVALRHRLADAAQSLPQVAGVSPQVSVPFWSSWDVPLFLPGIDSVSRLGAFELNAVGPAYFTTMGTRLLRGRGFTDADDAASPRVMVVSATMARTLWPGRDALGQCVHVGADSVPCTTVVGIAEDIKADQLTDDPGRYYYLAAAQWHPDMGGLFVRARPDAAHAAEAIRARLQREMPGAAYVTVTPLADVVGGETRSWQLGATMFLVFGLLALLLAAVGLYSVIAYDVAQRTHEIGVRLALGAAVADVMRMVLAEGVRLAAAGIVVGGALALAAGRWVQPLLFDESARDPWIVGSVAAVLLCVAAAASALPAWRAARVNPGVALRAD